MAVSTSTATSRSTLRLMRHRGTHERAEIHAILDAALVCHVGYVLDGQPYVTPTCFWREGEHLYWHGSGASRAIAAQTNGLPVCLTVTHCDGLVIARSGFHCSINYRSVMAFGTARLVTDPARKRAALEGFMDRLMPGRAAQSRPIRENELRGTSVAFMEIEEAAAKVRSGMPKDDEEDYALPIWAGMVDLSTVVAGVQDDPRLAAETARSAALAEYAEGTALDALLHRLAHPRP
jgi:hypothetical protein